MADTSVSVLVKASKKLRSAQGRAAWPLALGACCALVMSAVPEVGATELTRIGFLDQSQIEASAPFRVAATQLQGEKTALDAEFAQAMRRARSTTEQQHLNAQFSQRFSDRQATILGPVFARARAVIGDVAARRGISVVVDKRILIVGGTDLTAAVITRLQNPAPLENSPSLPLSNVGYVDQDSVNTVPRIKAANDRFQTAVKALDQATAERLRDAKSDAERALIASQDQDSHEAKQHEIIDPVVQNVHDVISEIAERDHLILVVDKTAVMSGGRDVTGDVTAGLH